MTELWSIIGKMRYEGGINQVDIASALGVTRQTVGNWKARKPQLKHAEQLVAIYPQYITLKDCGHE